MRQVIRQDHKGFKERKEKHGRDHHREKGDEFPHHPADGVKRHKGGNGTHDRHGNGRENTHRPFHSRIDGRHPFTFIFKDDIGHDDAVIHKHSDHGDDRSQGDDIQRLVDGIHINHCKKKRNRDTKRRPERCPYIQEEEKDNDH